MSEAPSTDYDATAQVIRDHRLQPRIRHEDAEPAADFECLCGAMFWGVAEWSQHVALCVAPPASSAPTEEPQA